MLSHPSPEEAGRYLETYKAYEQKPADLLMEKLEQDFVSRVRPLAPSLPGHLDFHSDVALPGLPPPARGWLEGFQVQI